MLREPRLDDADAFAEILGDADVMRFLGGETVPREDVPAVLRKWLRRWEANRVGPFVLERRDDGRIIGRAGEHAQLELGWAIGRPYWGNGYATEAALAVRDWTRGEHGTSRLISLINPANVRSQRVAERLGAEPTETVTLFDGSPAVVWVHPEPR